MKFESKKSRKRILQGMEHLERQVINSSSSGDSYSSSSPADPQNQDKILKKDLTSVIVLMSVLFMVLVAILVLDKTGEYFNIFTEKVTNFFTN